MRYRSWDDIIDRGSIMSLISDHDGEARLVGGCVRDLLLEKEAHDIDLATNLPPMQVMQILQENNIKCVATGLKHGTITAIINSEPIEITTLRRDLKCDGRHAVTEFTDDWQEDAARRDFTFNALYCDISNKIYDYFGGKKDLENRRLRFVGDTEKRICEDYLRMLRAFRFHAQIECIDLDQDILNVCQQYASKINILSLERITHEMLKLLQCRYAGKSLMAMQKCNLLKEILPWDISIDNKEFISKDAIVNLAIILRASKLEKYCKDIVLKLRLSKKQHKQLQQLAQANIDLSKKKQKLHIYKLGKEIYLQTLIVYYHENKINYDCMVIYYKSALNIDTIKCPINGEDLINLGYKQGAQLGVCLKQANHYWQSNNCLPDKNDLLNYVKSLNKKNCDI